MSPSRRRQDPQLRALDERLALLSVQQELTVGVLELFETGAPVDHFLERVAARLGCRVAACVSAPPAGGGAALVGAAGLARASRELPLPGVAAGALEAVPWPWPEIAPPGLARWALPAEGAASGGCTRLLLLWFDREPRNAFPFRAMLGRLAGRLGAALAHRELHERVVGSERSLKALNDELEARVAARTEQLAAANRELTESLRTLEATQALLLQSAKLAAVGQLAAGVAHEINNPLAYVLGNVDVALGLSRRGTAAAELVQPLEDALEGIDRVRRVVRDLRTFARSDEEGAPPFADLADAVRTATRIAGNEIRHRAHLDLDVRDVPLVAGSPHRIGQVLLNLLVNAAQAFPEGREEANRIRLAVRPRGERHVLVEVADTGAGIPAEALPRIFDPFYTTKAPGVGTGLGLSICHGIVSRLGGEITVESRVGEGSVFSVLLPVAEPGPPEPPAPAAEAAAPSTAPARARVLLVDDDELVARVVARMLAERFDVAAVQRPREALARVEAGERFDAVVCDLMMPEMTGMAFHAAAAAAAPVLRDRFLFVTGGTISAETTAFLDRGARPILQKPFRADDLVAAVEAVVGRP